MIQLHHVKIRSKNCLETSKKLMLEFDLKPIANRRTEDIFQLVFSAGQTVFVVTEVKNKPGYFDNTLNCPASAANCDELIYRQKADGDKCSLADIHHGDSDKSVLSVLCDQVLIAVNDFLCCEETIYDVAFKVENLHECVEGVAAFDEYAVIINPINIISNDGSILFSLVKSCVGNVFHSLIDCTKYSGPFLPGYNPINEDDSLFNQLTEQSVNTLYTTADHVTYAIPRGNSVGVISWYENVFGMKRFFLNRNDSLDSGLVIQGKDVGLRLFALDFWKCAEVGLRADTNFTIVLAESLEGQGRNQIDTFLTEHECAGVQHIGLGTSDIYTVMDKLKRNGVRFMIPPPTYYTKIGKSDEIMAANEDIHLLEKYGILLDTETDEGGNRGIKFLMQVFTAPLFSRDTFFLEVIQRKGARGFGAGNITALWRSVAAYLQQKT